MTTSCRGDIVITHSRIKKLEKKCKPSISHHKAWLKSMKRLSMKKRFGIEDQYFTYFAFSYDLEAWLTRDERELRYHHGQTLIKMKEEKAKKKGVSNKDVDDSSRPERSILTLKPLPTIDPKDKECAEEGFQDKYVDEILKKFGFLLVKTSSTPMETSKLLMKDENSKDVDVHLYRSMIGSLMYLASLRLDIMFADSPFDLEAYTDSNYASASLDRKSTIGACQFLKSRLISWQSKKQTIGANSTIEEEYVVAASCCGQNGIAANDEIQVSAVGLTYYTLDNGEIELTAIIDGKVKIVTKASIRRHLQLANSNGISSLPNTNIFKQLSLIGVNTLGSDKGSMTLQELMVLCTTLSKKVESLETDLQQTKLTCGAAYTKLIKKVKKLENKVKSSQARRRAKIIVSNDEDDLEDPSKQGKKIAEIDQDPAISLVQHDTKIRGRHEHDMESDFDLDAAKDVSTAKLVSTAGAAVTTANVAAISTASPTRRVSIVDDITMAETLMYIRKSAAKDKAAIRLQAKLEEEEMERITRVHEAASSFNVEEWEDIQARVKGNEELAQRLQAEEREMYPEAEQERMLVELINQRKSYFAAQKAKERRNKPPTQAQQRTLEPAEEPKDKEEEISQEELQQMLIIVPEQGMNVEALQTKYPIIDLEIYAEGIKNLVKENFKSTEPTDDKEREIWVELKRLFEPDTDDELWKLQNHIHDLTWRLYDSYAGCKALGRQDNEMSKELLKKIFMPAKRPRR
ncbi:hypothetical protein Tco_0118094 [Tanacetum coccineum]